MLFQQRLNPWSQLALLFGFCGVGIVLSSIITAIIGNVVLHVPLVTLADELMKPENVSVDRLLQVFTTFLVMALPAFLSTYAGGGNAMYRIGLRQRSGIMQLGIVVLMVFFGFMLGDALSELNRIIPLSADLEKTFKEMEDTYSNQVMAIASMKSFADYFTSLIVLAILPAIFEEMLFRGSLQQIMIGITRNAFLGIFITSVVFSAIHLSYYGFLPRLALGMMLGYIFYFSKNLWLSITAHFIQNAYTLTILFLYSREGKNPTDAFEESFPWYYGIAGAVVVVSLFLIFKKESARKLAIEAPITQEDHGELV
ncbi:MAG TPA: CPBP family intramembrane metalloprotease [Panacibacter sp.]|mgnify:FL=1|nr:CPBP family intramembrane metalloprotease [Panacibacter sp.]HNP44147.1 CPBP family intramembrane metalloprotease [Panacibacter sp.]